MLTMRALWAQRRKWDEGMARLLVHSQVNKWTATLWRLPRRHRRGRRPGLRLDARAAVRAAAHPYRRLGHPGEHYRAADRPDGLPPAPPEPRQAPVSKHRNAGSGPGALVSITAKAAGGIVTSSFSMATPGLDAASRPMPGCPSGS